MAKLSANQLQQLRETSANGPPNKIRLALELTGERQLDVAAGTGIAQSNLSQIVNGQAGASLETARRIAAFFGAAIEDIFPPQSTEAA